MSPERGDRRRCRPLHGVKGNPTPVKAQPKGSSTSSIDQAFRFQIRDSEGLKVHLLAPPDGSAAARARDFGVDILATARKLTSTTPDERLSRLDDRIEDLRALRRGNR
jgi:hypothetical protein